MGHHIAYLFDINIGKYYCSVTAHYTAQKKPTIHEVTTMLATSKNVLFPGHNHLLTTCTNNSSLAGAQAIIKVSSHQYRWLAWWL